MSTSFSHVPGVQRLRDPPPSNFTACLKIDKICRVAVCISSPFFLFLFFAGMESLSCDAFASVTLETDLKGLVTLDLDARLSFCCVFVSTSFSLLRENASRFVSLLSLTSEEAKEENEEEEERREHARGTEAAAGICLLISPRLPRNRAATSAVIVSLSLSLCVSSSLQGKILGGNFHLEISTFLFFTPLPLLFFWSTMLV